MRSMDFKSASCGKETGLGRPPAKEITPGSEAAFRMLLTKDGGVAFMPSDNIFSIRIITSMSEKLCFIVILRLEEINDKIVWQTIL